MNDYNNAVCQAMRELLDPCLDQTLDPAEREKYLSHLQGCSACHTLHLAVYETRRLFQGIELHPPPESLPVRMKSHARAPVPQAPPV
ncbi:MAG: zf-HC2 domain-containing protein [Bryobacterales bacterium]|nr:zf-HC2 domain-containing protein [Bryobacterales bacterium]